MKTKQFISILIIFAILLTGCGISPDSADHKTAPDGTVLVGNHLQIEPLENDFRLQYNQDTLAADGLYYAAWSMGDAVDYVNTDGDTVDLYDAYLYLLFGESSSDQTASDNTATWLSAAYDMYEVTEKKDWQQNGQSYTLISYQCTGTETPYSRGVSAFCTWNSYSLCIELTCQENFSEDLESLLTDFISHCHFTED